MRRLINDWSIANLFYYANNNCESIRSGCSLQIFFSLIEFSEIVALPFSSIFEQADLRRAC